ncbi:midkine b [Gasterosteus aculeatus]|uniref:midkine b n=1 Tax=Gasterosteus aculeatus aculeatus TaxID=481459 RepID=UPI001A99215D|nr:midkine b [Gasterosteus aculeatus aculeatus]
MKSLLAVLLLLALTLPSEANRRAKNHKGGKQEKSRLSSECSTTETQFGKCVPKDRGCGDGLRDASCRDVTEKIYCKVPCNWKKDIGDCKYKFGPWGSCEADTDTKSRSGTLKRALFNAECQPTVRVSKPCSPIHKK